MKHIDRQSLILHDGKQSGSGLFQASVMVTLGGQSARVPATISEDGCVSAFGLVATFSREGKTRQLPAVIYEWENLDGTITETAAYGQHVQPVEQANLHFDSDTVRH